jgi:hypothetical protein
VVRRLPVTLQGSQRGSALPAIDHCVQGMREMCREDRVSDICTVEYRERLPCKLDRLNLSTFVKHLLFLLAPNSTIILKAKRTRCRACRTVSRKRDAEFDPGQTLRGATVAGWQAGGYAVEQPLIIPKVLPFRRRWHVISEVDLGPLLADHAAVRRMCRDVEALADRLGSYPSIEERSAIADMMHGCIREHVAVTSELLERLFAGEHLTFGGGILTRILLDQIADGVHAEDVAEALRAEVLEPEQLDMLGYMLRCLFDSCRRALDFEELALLALGGKRLSTEARMALEHILEERPEGAAA